MNQPTNWRTKNKTCPKNWRTKIFQLLFLAESITTTYPPPSQYWCRGCWVCRCRKWRFPGNQFHPAWSGRSRRHGYQRRVAGGSPPSRCSGRAYTRRYPWWRALGQQTTNWLFDSDFHKFVNFIKTLQPRVFTIRLYNKSFGWRHET